MTPDPALIATEGALWGSVKAHDFLPDTVLVGKRKISGGTRPAVISDAIAATPPELVAS